MTATERHKYEVEIAKLRHENDYYKDTEKYRATIVKALAMISLLASLIAVVGWLN